MAAPADVANGWPRHLTPHRMLIVVGIVYALVVLGFALRVHLLTWDEVIYASQFASRTAPAPMTAPRAWGMPLLLAPVDLFTSSVLAIRLYLTVLSGIGMYLAFRPWLRVVTPWVVPVAAGLFATLWSSVIFGAMAYPNLWLGFAVVAGVGFACRALVGPTDRWALLGAATAFVIASMIRPTDASYLAVPLLLVFMVRRAWRPLAAVSVGLAVGWIAWTGEAFLRFGGPVARLRLSSEITGVMLGFHPLPMLQALDGPNLQCRPATLCTDIHLPEVVWVMLLPLLVVAGIVAARDRLPYLIAGGAAACVVLTYMVTLDWFNPRYLIPAYALLALPVASALVTAVRWRAVMAVVIAAALILHVGTQVLTYQRVVKHELQLQAVLRQEASTLRRTLGVRAPCVIFGVGSVELSFVTHCRPVLSAQGQDAPEMRPSDPVVRDALASGEQVVLMVRAPAEGLPAIDGWRSARLKSSGQQSAYVADPPAAPAQP